MTILLLLLMIASISLFITRARNPSAYWMASILLGWFLSMSGLTLFLAKYGGFYYRVNIVLFWSDTIRNLLLHSPISIEGVSRMITIGRSIFIYGLIGMSVTLYDGRPFRKTWKIYAAHAVLPLANIIFYDPVVYKWALGELSREQTYVISWITRGWLVVSASLALWFMLWKYRRMSIPWVKKQLQLILLGVFALVLFYFYLGFMGPLQVSDVRTYYVLYSDFSNFNPPLTLPEWYLGIIVTGVLSAVSIVSIYKYTEVEKKLGQSDLQLQRKLNTANMGARVFTHALKNQLLTLQLLMKQTAGQLAARKLDDDEAIRSNVDKAARVIDEMLQRLDQLYKSFKTAYLQLKPTDVNDIVRRTLAKHAAVPGHITLSADLFPGTVTVLADAAHLSEALHNVVTNAIEAIDFEKKGFIRITTYPEDRWAVIRVEDNGRGIAADQLEFVFDPFYTNKNTTKNWGVGLSYAKQVINGHFGYIHVESKPGTGTVFQISLPVYAREQSLPSGQPQERRDPGDG
jgi:signal transduction histidine kinase